MPPSRVEPGTGARMQTAQCEPEVAFLFRKQLRVTEAEALQEAVPVPGNPIPTVRRPEDVRRAAAIEVGRIDGLSLR